MLHPAWPVKPDVSEVFMQAFYTAWAETQNKTEAYYRAIAVTQRAHPAPKDWGAFVLTGE